MCSQSCPVASAVSPRASLGNIGKRWAFIKIISEMEFCKDMWVTKQMSGSKVCVGVHSVSETWNIRWLAGQRQQRQHLESRGVLANGHGMVERRQNLAFHIHTKALFLILCCASLPFSFPRRYLSLRGGVEIWRK